MLRLLRQLMALFSVLGHLISVIARSNAGYPNIYPRCIKQKTGPGGKFCLQYRHELIMVWILVGGSLPGHPLVPLKREPQSLRTPATKQAKDQMSLEAVGIIP